MLDEASFLILGLGFIYLYLRKKREMDREEEMLTKIERYLDKVLGEEEESEEESEKEDSSSPSSPFSFLPNNKMTEKEKEQLTQLSKAFGESLANMTQGTAGSSISKTLENMLSGFVNL